MIKSEKEKTPVQRLLVPPYILFASKFLTSVSPFFASRFAARLFLTPFRYKRPARETEMYENSRKEKLTIPSIRREIVVFHYGNAPKKILLVHGWSGSGTQLAVLAKALLNNGYSVIGFDAPAHGDAPGKISMMPFFGESMHFLDKKYGPFEAVIGHSLGGMASLKAVKDGLKTQKLIIIGTANSVSHITKDFAKVMKFNENVARRMKKYLDRKFHQNMDDYSGAVSAQAVKIPTLVIHDKQDVDVPVEAAREIDAQLENSQLWITQNLGHRKILGDKKTIQKIINFITE